MMKHGIWFLSILALMSMVACAPSGSSLPPAEPQKQALACVENLVSGEPAVIAKSAYRMRQICGITEDEFLALVPF